MVRSTTKESVGRIYLCEVCEFGYEKKERAEACETYCTENKACSIEITQHAVCRL